MFDVADSLQPALARAAQSLARAQKTVARANAGAGSGADGAMAATARAALFQEALMNAVHARLNELKAASR
ncbi:MAG: hypothetical protein KGN02_05645 [bacterium]|nr:hypothetical protein [bacterium]